MIPSSELLRLLASAVRPAILIHGGAGTRVDAPVEPCEEGAARAAEIGFRVLAAGGSALNAVEAAVTALEEDPTFNAGRGACLTSDGTVEMDASIMDGRTLDAGAVASIRLVRSPIRLARRVMLESDHLLLAGVGAERFAREQGERFEPEEWFITPEQRQRWEELARAAGETGARPQRRKLGTVGAVAVDFSGHVAAATSTGGTAFKRPGRVGDTPLIGCGTYADDLSGAVSCTGHGESIIKTTLARRTCDALAAGADPQVAAEQAALHLRERVGGDGGLIVIAPDGRAGWAMNTPRMTRALMRAGMNGPIARVDL